MTDIPFHPLANIFPLIEGQDFRALVEDIREHGLREPVILFEGQVLDGRNRLRACHAAQVDARFETFPAGADPLDFVISKNLRRRQLSDDQRRMVAARLATLGRGRPGDNAAECGISRADAARMLTTDEAGVERARTVIARGVAALADAVEQGRLTVAAASKAAVLGADVQAEVVRLAGEGKRREIQTALKGIRRRQRENDLAAKQRSMPDKQYGVILADPEWRFDVWSRETGMDRAADNHYPTSELQAIKDRTPPAADDAVLFLWATVPMLPQALEVMAAWGFAYKSHRAWKKARVGTGYWFRNAHELLLVGTKGEIPAPAMGSQFDSVGEGDNAEHSRKPDWQYELIESYFPNLPKIELNARRARPGWDAWGYEAPEESQANGSESEGMKQPAAESAGASAGMKPLPCRLADGRTSDSCSSEIDGQAEAASAVSATQFDPATGEIIEDDGSIPAFLRREAGARV